MAGRNAAESIATLRMHLQTVSGAIWGGSLSRTFQQTISSAAPEVEIPPQQTILFTLEIDGQTRLEQPVSADRLMPLASVVEVPTSVRDDFIEPLRGILEAGGTRIKTIFLSFELPCGMLPSLPWDLLLQKELGCRVIRKSYLTNTSELPRQFDIILCACTELPKQAPDLAEVVRKQAQNLAGDVRKVARAICDLYNAATLHVYCDRTTFDFLKKTRWPVRAGFQVAVYKPPVPTSAPATTRSAVLANVESEFLAWVSATFPEARAADIVHFIAPTYRGLSEAGIVLPNVASSKSKFEVQVTPEQVATFATQVGAWAVGFDIRPDCVAPGDVRFLADGIARQLPGSVFVHDWRVDPTGRAVNKLYRWLCGMSEAPNEASLVAYCPVDAEARLEEAPPENQNPASESIEKLDSIRRSASKRKRPSRWIAAAQRFLESDVLDDASTVAGASAKQAAEASGAQAAIEFLTGLALQYATAPAEQSSGAVAAVLDGCAQAIDAASAKLTDVVSGVAGSVDHESIAQAMRATTILANELGTAGRLVSNLLTQPKLNKKTKKAMGRQFDALRAAAQQVELTKLSLLQETRATGIADIAAAQSSNSAGWDQLNRMVQQGQSVSQSIRELLSDLGNKRTHEK